MAMNASRSLKNLALPISVPAREADEESEKLIKRDDKLFKGSAMTKRGAFAAISYMSCAAGPLNNTVTPVPLKTSRHTLPLSGAYLFYMPASMEAVRGVNVPMYTTIRRTTVIFAMIAEYLMAGQKYTIPVIGRGWGHII